MFINMLGNLEVVLLCVFSFLAFFNALFVLYSRNLIHSILYLVLVFFSICCVLILLGADFIAAIFLMIYAGAIAMLFIFVFMMINIKKTANIFENFDFNILKAFILGILLFMQLCFVLFKAFLFECFYTLKLSILGYTNMYYKFQFLANLLKGIGLVFYTNFNLVFIFTGILLLLGMVITILLVIENYSFYAFFFFQSRKLVYKTKYNRRNLSKGISKENLFL